MEGVLSGAEEAVSVVLAVLSVGGLWDSARQRAAGPELRGSPRQGAGSSSWEQRHPLWCLWERMGIGVWAGFHRCS